jgi:two-component system sensor histidine kinase VicK
LQSTIVNRQKQQIELILNNIRDGVIVIDQDGKSLIINRAAERLIKKMLSIQITADFNFVLSSGHIFFDTVKSLFLSNDVNEKVVIEATPDLYLEFTVALNSSVKQNSLVTIIEFRDITPFIEFENVRKKFVSVISHELRTPISALNLSLINLQKYGVKLSEDQKIEIISSMGRSAAILNQQVDDLLILSRFDAGKSLNLKWETYHVSGAIYSVIAQLEPKIFEKRIKVKLIGSPEVELAGDVQRIEQIVRIILDNAIKYSVEESKIIINVTDNYRGKYVLDETEFVLISITDHGLGISKKDMQHIFTRFYRSDDVAHIQGTGIGLALARELVELHQGAMYAESEYKKGSTFFIVLPKLIINPKNKNTRLKRINTNA